VKTNCYVDFGRLGLKQQPKLYLMNSKLLFFCLAFFCLLKTNAQNWLLAGNNGTTSTNFVGTKDNQPLMFRTNNVERLRLGTNGYTGFNTTTPQARVHIRGVNAPNWCLQCYEISYYHITFHLFELYISTQFKNH
jgi:hypothetical protein